MVRITDQKINVAALQDAVMDPTCGAVVVFEGVVRNHDKGETVSAITYEAYAAMAEKEMQKIVNAAQAQWADVRLAAQHRVGHLTVGEISVAVAAAAPHRKEAFEAARFVIDRIKETVPIWKKQVVI